jgi:hypothetical protein
LVLRFFCYAERYEEFKHEVARFLDGYLRTKNEELKTLTKKALQSTIGELTKAFEALLVAAKIIYSQGFGSGNSVPRVRFEALAVGLHLALKAGLNAKSAQLHWLDDNKDKPFGAHVRTDASNSGPRLRARIEFVRDQLLGGK